MSMKTKSKFIVGSSVALLLLGVVTSSVHAEDSISGSPLLRDRNASTTDRMGGLEDKMTRRASTTWSKDLSKMIERGDKEIDRRIDALKKQSERITSAKRVSDDGKSMISNGIQSQIDILTVLRAKIDADTDEVALKADLKSITASHRIFALIMPQAAITAATERIKTIAADLSTISTKLKTRIEAAQTVGKDVTAMNTALTHMNAQIADALVQAGAAKDKIALLVPDNGDATVAASNKTALLIFNLLVRILKQF